MQPANTHTHTDIHTYIYMCTYIHLCLPIGFVHTLPHTHTHTYTQQATHRTAAAARKLRIRLVWRRQLKKCTKQKCAEKERVQQQVMANVQQQGHTIYCICICIILCVRVCKVWELCMCSPRLAISGAFALELDELIMYVTYKRLLCVCVCANNSNNNYSKNNKSWSNYNNNNS